MWPASVRGSRGEASQRQIESCEPGVHGEQHRDGQDEEDDGRHHDDLLAAGFLDELGAHALARVLGLRAQDVVEGVIVALERGTPLADVLRAQAQDVREMGRRELMEAAGRKEIQMMVPLVFGILPLTVIFAVFPGISLMRLGF